MRYVYTIVLLLLISNSYATPLSIAQKFVGLTEHHHYTVLDAFIGLHIGKEFSVRATPWCAFFVSAVLNANFSTNIKYGVARQFLKYGKVLDKPKKGDIIVLTRGKGWQGHVGFFIKFSKDKKFVYVLGGNQNNSVSIKKYSINRVLGYRGYL